VQLHEVLLEEYKEAYFTIEDYIMLHFPELYKEVVDGRTLGEVVVELLSTLHSHQGPNSQE
jgi:hypothetical protein